MASEPLSRSLESLLREERAGEGGLTLNQVFARTGPRGAHLLMVLLTLPFLLPVSIPGVSTPFGLVVAWLAWRQIVGAAAALPRWLGDRPLPPGFQHKVLVGGRRVLLWIERLAKPRRTSWLGWRTTQWAHALLIMVLAVLLALPLPIPFTNTLPSWSILLIAVSTMEEDGLLIWLAYLGSALTLTFFGFAAFLGDAMMKYIPWPPW